MKIPALRLQLARRPLGEVTPLTRAHDIEPYRRCAQLAAIVENVGTKPGERLAQHWPEAWRRPMRPWTDEQVGIAAGGLQRLVIAQLPREEDIVPAGDEVGRSPHVAHPRTMVGGRPPVVAWHVFEERLKERHRLANANLIGLTQRKLGERRLELALLLAGQHAEDAEALLLVRDLVRPAQRVLQRVGAARMLRTGEIRGGDLGRDGFE